MLDFTNDPGAGHPPPDNAVNEPEPGVRDTESPDRRAHRADKTTVRPPPLYSGPNRRTSR